MYRDGKRESFEAYESYKIGKTVIKEEEGRRTMEAIYAIRVP
jgi:hypothetical protein